MSDSRMSSGRFFCLILLCFFIPPIAVAIEFEGGHEFCVNLLLWLFIPFGGFIHGVYIICKKRYSKQDRHQYESAPDEEQQTVAPAQPPIVKPTPAQPAAAQPAASQPAASQPAASQQPLVDPPAYSPPTGQTPGTNIVHDNKVQHNN